MKYILFLLFFFSGLYSAEEKKERRESSSELTEEEVKILAQVNSDFNEILDKAWKCTEKGCKFESVIFQDIYEHISCHKTNTPIPVKIARKADALNLTFLCLDCNLEFKKEAKEAYEDHLKNKHFKEVSGRKKIPLWGTTK